MRLAAIPLLALALLTGCFTLHAHVPEEAVRLHLAQEEELDLGSICSFEGQRFSEGALACMGGRRMVCDPAGRWKQQGEC